MEELRAKLAQMRERFGAAAPRTRVAIIAAIGAVISAATLLYVVNATPTRSVLFSNLAQQDAARIVERLDAMNIEYELGGGGTTILVDEERVHETRLTLAAEGLPNGGGVGFEIFDTQRFGESDFTEQVQFRRALEGELSRTIGHLAGVQSARVHLVLPERTLFTSESRGASASVALHLTPGWRLRDEQVQGVAHLVASSVPGLTPDNVTVVDGEGRSLTTSGGDEVSAAGTQELQARIESSRQRAIQQLLDTSLGPGVSLARVSADVDLSHEENLEETYDPARTATRSFEIREEGSGSGSNTAQGIPGAASNLPGGPAAETQGAETGLSSRTERRNFEVTKMVRRAVHPVGRLQRLTIAVVVDGIWNGEGDERAFEPRDDEELERIRSLVASAAGVNEERGDVVTVQCVPFASSREVPEEPFVDPLQQYEPYFPYARYAAVALLVLVVLIALWIRRRRRRRAEAKAEAEAKKNADPLLGPGLVDELATPHAIGGGAEGDAITGPEALEAYEQLRALAVEVAKRDPELAARVVRGWLAEESSAAVDAEKAAA